MCMWVHVADGEGSWVFARATQVELEVWMAVYLTGYSDCLTS